MTQRINHITKAGRRFVLASAILFSCLSFLYAQEHAMRIYYRFDSAVVDTTYLSNAQAFEVVDKMLSSGPGGSFEIVSYSSPEGSSIYNQMLSERRAKALRAHLLSRYPELSGKLALRPVAEAWDLLREKISEDSHLSEKTREKVISIVNSYESDDVKESKLSALASWRYLYATYFRQLRFAEVRCIPERDSTSSAEASGVHFALESDKFDENYSDNKAALESIFKQLEGLDLSEVSDIRIEATSSPDGTVAVNERFCRARAESLRARILKQYPALAGKISVHSAGEAWEGLRLAVDSDPALSDDARSEILSIIVSPAAADEKEAKLRALPAWEHLLGEVFPGLRCASVKIEKTVTSAEPALPATEPAVMTGISDITEPEVTVEPEVTIEPEVIEEPVRDTVAQVVPEIAPTEPNVFRPMKTVLALKTNLLFDLATAFNFEVEVPIKDRYSLMVEDVFPWWETGNKYCFQWWEMGLEARYWLKPWDVDGTDKLRGLFGGIYAMSGKYDLQYDRKINYQGEFWSAGITAGYSLPLGRKKWGNLEMSLGLGFLQSDYRHYYPADDYSRLYRDRSKDGKLTWFGPTKAKVSLVIPINIPLKKEVRYE